MTSQDFIVILQRNNEALLYEIKAGQDELRREFKADLAENTETLRREFKAGQDELNAKIDDTRNELNAKIDGVYTELKADNAQTHAEIKKLQDDVLISRIRSEDLNTTIVYGFSFIGILIAAIGLFATLAPIIREAFTHKEKPEYITRSEVQEMINNALKSL